MKNDRKHPDHNKKRLRRSDVARVLGVPLALLAKTEGSYAGHTREIRDFVKKLDSIQPPKINSHDVDK